MKKYKGYFFFTKKEMLKDLLCHEDDDLIYVKDGKIKVTNMSPEDLEKRGLI